jgi:hypothetical protein
LRVATTLRIRTFSITTLDVKTLSIMTFSMTINKNETFRIMAQRVVRLSTANKPFMMSIHCVDFCYVECTGTP